MDLKTCVDKLAELRSMLAGLASGESVPGGYARVAQEAVAALGEVVGGGALPSIDEGEVTSGQHAAEIEALYERAPIGLCYLDMQCRYVRINQRLAQMHGCSVEAHLGKTVQEVIPDSWGAIRPWVERVMARGEPEAGVELELGDTKRREMQTWLVNYLPMRDESGRMVGVSVSVQDISERKQAERELRAREALYRAVFDHAPIGIALGDLEGTARYLECNEAQLAILGYTREELMRLGARDITHPDDLAKTLRLYQELRAGERDGYSIDKRYLRKDGREVWGRLTVSRVSVEGQKDQVLALLEDVTERHAVAEALRESEDRFRQAVAEAPLPVMIHAEGGEIVEVNKAFTRVTGYERADVPTTAVWAHKAFGEKAEEIRAMISSSHRGDEVVRFDEDLPVRTKAGGVRRWLVSSAPLGYLADGRRLRISMATDVTETREAERHWQEHLEQVAHISRLNLMGEMAAGLAHELNQPLAAIVNYAQGCLHQVEAEEQVNRELLAEGLRRAVAQTARAGEIIARIREMVRKHKPRRGEVDVNGLIEEAVALAKSEATKHSVEVRLNLAADLPRLRGDTVQLEQVILNLLWNAIEAIAPAAESERRVEIATQAGPEGQLLVRVSDTGTGVSDEMLGYLFHPFYTTKSEGMGMGLNICQSIVELHGGRISAARNEAGGMTFELSLPTEG